MGIYSGIFAKVSLVLVFLSLEKTLTGYKLYYLVVFSLVFFIAIDGKELQLFVLFFFLSFFFFVCFRYLLLFPCFACQ